MNICVLLGGPSAEREVSLKSGRAIARALRSLGHIVTELDPVGAWSLPRGTDVVFIALHGTYGEDGAVQGELEAMSVPFTGCDAQSSRIAFDKILTKERLVERGVPTAPHLVLADPDAPWPDGWNPPLVVKPVRQGSSVGLQFVDRVEQWPDAIRQSLAFDTRVLVEERIAGREVTVGILDGRALPVVEVRPIRGGFDYHNKYTAGATEYLCPAPFDEPTTARIQEAGVRAFEAVGGRDYGRVDVMVRPDGSPVVLEVNTLPGMTETSLLPKAAAAAGIAFKDLCQRMVDMAAGRRERGGAVHVA